MPKEPNTRLADLFELTNWSKGELARLVNRQAATMGCAQLSTDTSRVRRWMETGETPRDPVPGVLAALFTERLGRVVTVEDLGFRQRHRSTGRREKDAMPWGPARTAEILSEFTGMDLMLNRRGMKGPGVTLSDGSSLTAGLRACFTPGAGTDQAAAHPTPSGPRGIVASSGIDAPVGVDEVRALEESVEVFRAWDASRGGGLQRKAVVGQLNEVGGLVESHYQSSALRGRLWAVAANLAVLAGWMSHDVGLEPTAQRYFVTAVHAAWEAGDRPRAAEALSRAARQMLHLARPVEAAELIELAQRRIDEAPPTTCAMLRTIDAWAQGAMGRGQRCRRLLGEAEELFVARSAEPEPSWMRLFDEADLHGMQALALRTLAEHEPRVARAAQQHAHTALRTREQNRERSVLFDRVSLASACFLGDDPEQGVEQAEAALVEAQHMSSRRTWDRLGETYRLTAPYAELPAVRQLRTQLREAAS